MPPALKPRQLLKNPQQLMFERLRKAGTNWAERREALLERQRQIARTRSNQFAANRVVKHLARSQRPGVPVKTAAVFFDKPNSAFGNALIKEFQRRGVRTEGRGIIGLPAMNSPAMKDAARISKAEAVVFATKDNVRGQNVEKMVDKVIAQAENRAGQKKGTRLAMLWGLDKSITRKAIAVDAITMRKMREFTRKTFNAVQGSKAVRVKTQSGTDLIFGLSSRNRWVEDKGVISKNYWGNLPAGEVFTAPLTVNGTLVLDSLADNVGMVDKNPIRMQIRNGRVVQESVECSNPAAKRKLLQILQTDRNSSRIGELGLGTNLSITRPLGNILSDEKMAGVHVAFGDPYAHDTKARWESNAHNDCLLREPTIIVDGNPIMVRGKSLLKLR